VQQELESAEVRPTQPPLGLALQAVLLGALLVFETNNHLSYVHFNRRRKGLTVSLAFRVITQLSDLSGGNSDSR
jgi:hypothetical protein